MADIKCSKCGNIAHPGGFSGKDYKEWDGQIVCDSCYTELAKATAAEREAKEQAEQAAASVAMKANSEKNAVATILRVYAIINAALGLFISLFVADDYTPAVGILFFAVILGASFLIFSFGELIKLLHEIKLNTQKK